MIMAAWQRSFANDLRMVHIKHESDEAATGWLQWSPPEDHQCRPQHESADHRRLFDRTAHPLDMATLATSVSN